jgi:hypothetical protein
LGLTDNPGYPDAFVTVQFNIPPIERSFRYHLEQSDFATTFAMEFNTLGESFGVPCSPKLGTCLRPNIGQCRVGSPIEAWEQPSIVDSEEIVNIVRDVAVNITATDGSVISGRQGYSKVFTASGGDVGIISNGAQFDHVYGGTMALGNNYAWMLNEQCANHILYSASFIELDGDAGYDSSAATGCAFSVILPCCGSLQPGGPSVNPIPTFATQVSSYTTLVQYANRQPSFTCNAVVVCGGLLSFPVRTELLRGN